MVVRPVQRAKRKAMLNVLRGILQADRLLGHPPDLKWHRLAGQLVALKYHQNFLLDHLAALKYHQDPLLDHPVDPKYQKGSPFDHLVAPKCHLVGLHSDHLAPPKCYPEGPLLNQLAPPNRHPEGPLLDHLVGVRLDHRLGENKRMGQVEVSRS